MQCVYKYIYFLPMVHFQLCCSWVASCLFKDESASGLLNSEFLPICFGILWELLCKSYFILFFAVWMYAILKAISCCSFNKDLWIIFYNLRAAFVSNVFKSENFWKMLGTLWEGARKFSVLGNPEPIMFKAFEKSYNMMVMLE
jgi:hypothetical protein